MIEKIVSGVPTRTEVNALIEKFGVPEEGVVITYEEISKVIRHVYGTSRFRTIVSAWRKRIRREHEIEMAPRPRIGFEAACPKERVELSGCQIRRGVRALKKGEHIARNTDRARLDDDDKKKVDFITVTSTKATRMFAESKKQLPSGE
jgi:hypothetical protein